MHNDNIDITFFMSISLIKVSLSIGSCRRNIQKKFYCHFNFALILNKIDIFMVARFILTVLLPIFKLYRLKKFTIFFQLSRFNCASNERQSLTESHFSMCFVSNKNKKLSYSLNIFFALWKAQNSQTKLFSLSFSHILQLKFFEIVIFHVFHFILFCCYHFLLLNGHNWG